MRKTVLFPGQKIVTKAGEVATVAFVNYGQVFVFGRNGLPAPADPVTDAWGGEVDQTIGLAG